MTELANCAFERRTEGKRRKRFVWVCTRCGRREPYHAVLVVAGCKNPSGVEPVDLDRKRSELVQLSRNLAPGLRLVYKR
jgi:hypothetical protein